MNQQSDIRKKVSETLESLEGIQRAEITPYFFTRVKARLQRNKRDVWETISSILVRPAVVVAGLCLILGLNVFILFKKDTTAPSSTIVIQSDQLAVEEYILTAASNSYDYENLEP